MTKIFFNTYRLECNYDSNYFYDNSIIITPTYHSRSKHSSMFTHASINICCAVANQLAGEEHSGSHAQDGMLWLDFDLYCGDVKVQELEINIGEFYSSHSLLYIQPFRYDGKDMQKILDLIAEYERGTHETTASINVVNNIEITVFQVLDPELEFFNPVREI